MQAFASQRRREVVRERRLVYPTLFFLLAAPVSAQRVETGFLDRT